MLEEVVKTDEGEAKEEITFESLKYLELTCLATFKSFCYGEHTFIFPSLLRFKVIGCHKMQNFSYGVIIAPFFKSVEVENEKKRWKKDVNTTIQQLFIEKNESTSRALGFGEHGAESKVDEIVDSGKQEMHKLPIPLAGVDTKKIFEIPETPMDQTSQNTLSLTKADAGLALGTQDETTKRPVVQATHQDIRNQHMYKTLEKALVPAAENVLSSSIVDNIAVVTQETYESRNESVCDTKNVSSPIIVHDAAIDPLASQAPELLISPIHKSNIYKSYKGMIDIPEQNMPYFDAGVKRHPQVLDWLNTKQRRVLASSSFSLFAEVTRILRTTRRGHLTEDDRNYIKKCCTILEVVGFDSSWLNYVYTCIEECEDGEAIKRKVEETIGQASSLEAQLESMKKELASVKESLGLLLDKASRLDDFIES